jgi:hypothetical protein
MPSDGPPAARRLGRVRATWRRLRDLVDFILVELLLVLYSALKLLFLTRAQRGTGRGSLSPAANPGGCSPTWGLVKAV